MFSFDYLTQQPADLAGETSSSYPSPEGELMFGGGFASNKGCIADVGNVDDSAWNPDTAQHITEALGGYFEDKGGDGGAEHVKAVWSGIIGVSTDEKPWVGRVSESITGRKSPGGGSKGDTRLASPGEWIAAGYSGEGMVHAWLSGKALAGQVMGTREAELPKMYRLSSSRWRATGLTDLVARLIHV